jgi:tetratricopeptide (TPR) repeat protein
MAMIKNSTTFAFALLLIAATDLRAQEIIEDDSADPPQSEIPDDFLQHGQIVPVAEDEVDPGEDFSVPEETDENELLRQFELFKQLMQDSIFDEADSVAKRVVELAIQLKGPQSNEFAKALTNLAIVQFETGQYDAAQQNFESAIEIIEDNEDRLNAQLVNPLKGLASSQLKGGRPDLATGTFLRAVHVTHVNEGPHNLDQVELLESIAETHMQVGNIEAAKDVQDSIHRLIIRQYEGDSLAVVPSLMRRAVWQHRVGLVFDERATYRRVVRIIEQADGKDSLLLVEPLIMLGRSFYFADTSGTQSYTDRNMTSGEIYIKRAVRIANEHPESSWQIVTQATLALGDFYMVENNPQRGRQAYSTVWELLSDDDTKLNIRHEQLEVLVPLRQHDLPQHIDKSDTEAGLQSDDPLLQGSIVMTFEVSDRGRATSIELIESEQMLVHTYFYRQSDLDAIRAEADQAN